MLEITKRDDKNYTLYVETDELIEVRTQIVKFLKLCNCISMHGHNTPSLTILLSEMDFKFSNKKDYLRFINKLENYISHRYN